MSDANHTILIVEDEPALREGLRDALESEGYEVLDAPDGVKGLHLGLTTDPDLIILDLMLPGLDGFGVLRRLRADAVETPVLILTARGLETDKVKGLELGADDYLVKPFGLAELLARVASRLRAWDRERGRAPRERLRLGPVTVDFAARTVRRTMKEQTGPARAEAPQERRRDGDVCGLTQQEVALLRFLLAHEGRAVSRADLLAGVWSNGEAPASRVIDNAVFNLRRKIESDPAAPRHLVSVRGVGYRFSR